MSKFTDKIKMYITKAENLTKDESAMLETLKELRTFTEYAAGGDLYDVLSDYSDNDILEALMYKMPVYYMILKIPSILAQSELEDYLDAFKTKYPLFEIL